MFFGKVRHFRFPWCRECRVSDTNGERQAEPISDKAQAEVKNDELPELISELIREVGQLETGEYEAYIESYEYDSTRYKHTPYVKIRLNIIGKKKVVFAYVIVNGGEMPFFKFLMPVILHRRVRVKVTMMAYNQSMYPQARILEILD